MSASKSKSGLSEALSNKPTPATPKASKLGRAGSMKTVPDSASPLQNPRISVDRSPKSVESKLPMGERRSPKISTPPDKQPRALKGSELQALLNAVQEDLKKAKEQVVFVEKEKTEALEQLKDAKRLAEEANEKLQEALAAQKRAEESSEIEKFRTDELEQACIEAAHKKEEWQKELKHVQDQHALDVSALLATTQELQRLKNELAMITDAKNTALSHADDAMKIAEINAEKVELLSREMSRLKALLDSELESRSTEAAELVKRLDNEVVALKQELEKAKAAEEKLVEIEALVERLKLEVADAKKAESDVANQADEWKKKAELLGAHVDEATCSKESLLDSIASLKKQLDDSNGSLQDAESEIAALEGKLESLEIEVAQYKQDIDESNLSLCTSQQEVFDLGNTVEALKSELRAVEEEKMQALHNEKTASSAIESLSEERKKLADELETAQEEGEKLKKAMEGLTSALHEVSTEARNAKEMLSVKEAELENANTWLEELQVALTNTQESNKATLGETNYEIVCLKSSVEKLETEAKNSKAEWDEKESSFVSTVKKSEEEIIAIKLEMNKVSESLKGAEAEVQAVKEDGAQLLNRLKQVESELSLANKAVGEAKAEGLGLKQRLFDKENEVQSISQENDELRGQEAAAQEKIKELSALLAEATAKKADENGEVESSKSKKEYELLPEAKQIPENTDEHKVELPKSGEETKLEEFSIEETNVKDETGSQSSQEEEEESVDVEPKVPENCSISEMEEKEPADVEPKMPEKCNISEKNLLSERDHEAAESVDDDNDSKVDSVSLEQTNGLISENTENGATSPSKQLQQKKKKPLLQKFGSLLKKKSNHK